MSFTVTASTTETDKGFKAFIRELKILESKPIVKVGVIGQKKYVPSNRTGATPSSPPNVVDIASFNEFGAPSQNVPERSFLRATFDEKKKRWGRITEKLLDNIMTQKTTVKRALDALGIVITSDTRKKIVSINTPANKPATIKRKGSSSPLVDSGRLRQSITHQVVMGGKR